jgi:hypothetical protein
MIDAAFQITIAGFELPYKGVRLHLSTVSVWAGRRSCPLHERHISTPEYATLVD